MGGFADLHAHWMAHLGFGGHLIWGRPSGDMAVALRPCDGGAHGARSRWLGLDGARRVVDSFARIEVASSGGGPARHPRHGFPDFAGWPTPDTMCHQQMHVDWVRQAYEGGLRLLTMLAVNNRLLAWWMEGGREHWDDDAIRAQVGACRALVDSPANTGWMEVATSASDAERILAADKLVVVLGVEVDQLELLAGHDPRSLVELEGEATDYVAGRTGEARRIAGIAHSLREMGVRHVIPIHLADNAFGGHALYTDASATNTHWLNQWRWGRRTGADQGWPAVEQAPDDVEFKLLARQVPSHRHRLLPLPPLSRAVHVAGYADEKTAHANARGLSVAGAVLLLELWRRGVLIDIDHMSARATSAVLRLAERFGVPLIASHCSLRAITPDRGRMIPTGPSAGVTGGMPGPAGGAAPPVVRHEGMRTDDELRRISRLGGMIGVLTRQGAVATGSTIVTEGTAAATAEAYRHVVRIVGPGSAIALGTDANGMNRQPRVSPAGTPAAAGRDAAGARTWDIEVDGMAHYGLLPDLVAHWRRRGLPPEILGPLMRSAEGYVATMRRAEAAAVRLGQGMPDVPPSQGV
jgi:hypothetical protein